MVEGQVGYHLRHRVEVTQFVNRVPSQAKHVLIRLIVLLLYLLIQGRSTFRLHQESSLAYHSIAAVALACAALYEELLYRCYLPEMLQRVLKKLPHRLQAFLTEIIPLLLFSSAHHYLGIAAVINALCAGIVLRHCVLKTQSIIPSTVAHALYNIAIYAVWSRLI